MTLTLQDVQRGCEWQRRLCEKNGAPTYVALIDDLLARAAVADDPIVDLLLSESEDPVQSAQCLRLFGAVNRVAMAESAEWITDLYPVHGGETDTERAVAEFSTFLLAHRDRVAEEMRIGVQTNEVGRAAPLSAALNFVTAESGLPVRLLEVGSSGGLNLLLDKYRVEAGATSWGPESSPLHLAGHFVQGEPPAADVQVVGRRGCDLNPIDVHDDASARLLKSFVWPEHVERGLRLSAALEVARSEPPLEIDRSDATSWVRTHAMDLEADTLTVVFHSIVLPYLSPAEREKFVETVRECGAAATSDRPFAWISMEPNVDDSSTVEVTAELWPSGRRLLLARTTPHGTHVEWEPTDL